MARLSWREHAAVGAGLLAALIVFHWRVLVATGSAQGWLWEDALEYFYPVHALAAGWVARGSLPLWDPFTFAGMPHLADIGTGLLYPPNFLLALFTPGGHLSYRAFEWAMALHVWLGGFGTWLVARHLTRSTPAGVLAGLVFMLCGFMTAHSIHLSIVQTAAWLPLLFRLSLRAAEEGRARDAALAGLVLGLASLAGHPQTTLLLAGAALVPMFLHPWFEGPGGGGAPRWKRFARPVGLYSMGALLAAAVAAPQLLATRQLLALTIRQEMSYGAAAEGSFTPWSFITLLAPNFFGKAHGRDWSSYWGPGSYFYAWELAGFTGIAALVLAVFAVVRRPDRKADPADRRRVVILVALAAGGLLLAMGRHGLLHFLLYEALPPLRRLRIPGRAILLLDFAVALLAAYGVRGLMEAASAAERRRVTLLGRIAAAVLAAALILGFARSGGASTELRLSVARGALLQLALIGGAVVAVLLASGAGRLAPRTRALLLIALTAIDLGAAGWNYSAGRESPDEFFRAGREAIIAQMLEDGRDEYFRMNARPEKNPEALVLRRNSGPILGIYTIEGYNQLKLAVFQEFKVPAGLRFDLLNVKYRSELRPDALEIISNPGYLPRVTVVDRWRELKDGPEVLDAMNRPGFDPRAEVLLLPDADASGRPGSSAPPAPASPGAGHGAPTATIRRYTPNRIEAEVTTDVPALALFSEIWYPAWQARVDGAPAPVRRANYAFRAVPVPAGKHRVELTMSDAPLRRGAAVGALGLALAAGLVFLDERRRRR